MLWHSSTFSHKSHLNPTILSIREKFYYTGSELYTVYTVCSID